MESRGKEDEKNHHVGDGIRDDACHAVGMFLVGI
jgi:hypothetical protein